MKVKYILMFLIVLISCKGLNKMERNTIIYTIKNSVSEKVVAEKIKELKQFKEHVYVVFGVTDKGYEIKLRPINSLKLKRIQGMKLKNSNRVLRVNEDYYYMCFSADESLGRYLKSIKDKKRNSTRTSSTMNHNTIYLNFDKKWNLIDD